MKSTLFKQPLRICEKVKSLHSRLSLQLQSLCQSILLLLQSVHRVILDGLSVAREAASEIVESKRYTAGVILLLIVAPLSSIFYQVLDSSVRIPGWYYLAPYFLVYTLSPYIMLLFASVGIFLLFPVKCKTSYLATIWPTGYAITKILFFSFFVDTNEQFFASAPLFLLLIGFLAAIGFLMSANYLLYRKYHLRAGTIARIKGIIAAPGISASDKMRLLEDQSLELENFNQRY